MPRTVRTDPSPRSAAPSGRCGLVVSLDFELEWGVFDLPDYDRRNVWGARQAVPRMLEAFARHGVAATWATVGFLFAESKEELQAFSPAVRPTYRDEVLDPYLLAVGEDESDDPLHYAPSLLRQIAGHPRQEIASHTFSHYYCREPGQTAEQFDADLASAVAIAAARGHTLRSLVFPRHQANPDYLPLLRRHGIVAYREPEPIVVGDPPPGSLASKLVRARRLADVFVGPSGPEAVAAPAAASAERPVAVRSSRFLRPWVANARLDALRVGRVLGGMRAAARAGKLYHLWWHPHNFGMHTDENMASLERILEEYERLRDEHGFGSFTMQEVAEEALARAGAQASVTPLTPLAPEGSASSSA